MKQRTITRDVTLRGTALHTGEVTRLTFHPAPPHHGIVFQRADLPGHPEIRADIAAATDFTRATTLGTSAARVHTVEHVLSAAHGLGVDNLLIELEGAEPPILDGSARGFAAALLEAEPVDQDAERTPVVVTAPLSVASGASSVIALPHDGFRITCTSADDRGYHTQHLSIDIDPATYAEQIAAARTFTVYEDIEELLKQGKIRGGTLDNAIVIKQGEILSKEPLRYRDEFVRHKILDLVGDLLLCGAPVRAHIVAVRPGHAINCELAKRLAELRAATTAPAASPKVVRADEPTLDIRRLLQTLPHRYPFVMIDRVTGFPSPSELTAIKNVTINEPYFQGHFPGEPVMPGVLQLEAMAQAAGVLMLRMLGKEGKLALFMSAERVKFRRAVRPGDRIDIHVKLLRNRGGKIGVASGECRVDGQIASSAELMFMLVESFDET